MKTVAEQTMQYERDRRWQAVPFGLGGLCCFGRGCGAGCPLGAGSELPPCSGCAGGDDGGGDQEDAARDEGGLEAGGEGGGLGRAGG